MELSQTRQISIKEIMNFSFIAGEENFFNYLDVMIRKEILVIF